MEPFLLIQESDIFDDPTPEPEVYIPRPTSKGFVIDREGKIALLHIGKLSGLPGGGIEQGETPEIAFVRECMEELGCVVEIISYIGLTIQNRARAGKRQEIYYFVAKVIGEKGIPTTTEEDEKSVSFDWHPKDEVKTLFEEQVSFIPKDDYVMQFNCRTHLAAFKKYLETL